MPKKMVRPKMIASSTLVNDIESALAEGSTERRTEILLRVSDLFLGRAADYTQYQTTIFGTVMCQLMSYVEDTALMELSWRLAPVSVVPANVIQVLARNDKIEISGPVLAHSDLLTDDDLTEIAKTKSQAHLSRIAERSQLSEPVTSVLVDQGNANIADKVVKNSGARFSEAAMNMLVMRANGDGQLSGSIAARADIPPRLFRQLLAQATEEVRHYLLSIASPEQRAVIKDVLDDISTRVAKCKFGPKDYARARSIVQAFAHDTKRVKSTIAEFAGAKLIAEMIAALSLLSNVPIMQVDKMFMAPCCFGLMVLCKAIGLPWTITESVILNRPTELMDPNFTLAQMHKQYRELSTTSAQRLLKDWLALQKTGDQNSTPVNEICYID
jgi:hypothetical protein